MKVRADFVTNSSSASFLLGFTEDKLTKKQRNAVVEYVLGTALGHPPTLEEWDHLTSVSFRSDLARQAWKMQKMGWKIRTGLVEMDPYVYTYKHFVKGLWRALEDADPDNILLIDTDLIF